MSDVFGDSLTAAIAEQIMVLEPGSRLPSERELSEEMGVSRTALRDRLSRLESIGFLERRTGAGTFVRGLQPTNLTEALAFGLLSSDLSSGSLRTVRMALERQAAREAALHRTDEHLSTMAQALDQMQECDDPVTMHTADSEFHRVMLQASGSPALLYFVEALDGVLEASDSQRRHRMALLTIDRAQTRKWHRQIFVAIDKANGAAAMKAVDDHVSWLEAQMAIGADAI